MSKLHSHNLWTADTQILAIQFWKGASKGPGKTCRGSTHDRSLILPNLGGCRYVTRPWSTTSNDALSIHTYAEDWESNKIVIPDDEEVLYGFMMFLLGDMFEHLPPGAFIKFETWNSE